MFPLVIEYLSRASMVFAKLFIVVQLMVAINGLTVALDDEIVVTCSDDSFHETC